MTAANSRKTAKLRGRPFPKGVSGNPKGAPKRGESWAEIIKRIGDMTPVELANHAKSLAGQMARLGGNLTLKEAVVASVYGALLHEPTASLLNSFMERAEGKVPQPIVGAEEGPLEVLVRYATSGNPPAGAAPSPAEDKG